MILGGTLFVYNAESQDYCWQEAINSLCDLCDIVVVLDAGSTDGTANYLKRGIEPRENLIKVFCDNADWEAQKGKEKLNYFTNVALDELLDSRLKIDYHINLQADEIIHEDSFHFIRQAMETGAEGFLSRRYNLWGDPYHMLNVVQSRKPCSTEIIRLAKPNHRSVGDGESLECFPFSFDFLDKIEFFHMGYVRDPYIMKKKVTHMLTEVFQMDPDKRLARSDKYEPWDYFSQDDVIPIRKPLPKYVQDWAKKRSP